MKEVVMTQLLACRLDNLPPDVVLNILGEYSIRELALRVYNNDKLFHEQVDRFVNAILLEK